MSGRIVVRGSLAVVVLSLATIAVSLAGRESAELSRGGWNEARTAHFTVVAEGKNTAQRIATRLESFAAIFAERGHPIPGNGTVRVVVAPGERAFRDLAGPSFTSPESYVAVAILSPETPAMLVDLRERTDDAMSTVYRSYVQLALGLDASALPVWFREGMAEYYRTIGVRGVTALVGRPVKEHVYLLRDRAFIPWDEFFTYGRSDLDKLPRDVREVFQAQAWLVVHAQFSEGAKGKRELSTLLDIRSRDQVTELVRKAWDTDLDGVSLQMREYLKQGRLSYRQVEVMVPPAGDVKLVKVAESDVRTWFARAHDGAKELVGITGTKPEEFYEYPSQRQATGR